MKVHQVTTRDGDVYKVVYIGKDHGKASRTFSAESHRHDEVTWSQRQNGKSAHGKSSPGAKPAPQACEKDRPQGFQESFQRV